MVFDCPHSVEQFRTTELAWTQVFAGKDSAGGDALFVERDRDDGNLLLLLVDATGHGQEASVAVEDMREFLRLANPINHSPAELLKRLNGFATQATQSHMVHFEAIVAILDQNGRLTVSQAGGIPDVAIGRPGGLWEFWRPARVPFLGIAHGQQFMEEIRILNDTLALFATDGLAEAGLRSNRLLYKEKQWLAFLLSLDQQTALSDIPSRLIDDTKSFETNSWPADDITVAVLGVNCGQQNR